MLSLLCTLVAIAAPLLDPPVSRPDPLRTEVVVEASVEEVWHAWTTEAGLESWLAPAAEVELRPGGRYASNAIGKVGEDDTINLKILAYEPQRMLAFTTTAPSEEFPEVAAAGDTWAVVTLRPLDDEHTLVQHSALGWRDGDEWKRARSFFTGANRRLLDALRYHFQRHNVPVVTRIDRSGSFSRQFETPAPPEAVWQALTTPAGLSSWLGAELRVDFCFGGSITYSTAPGSEPIVERILAFDPERVLATRLDLPEPLQDAFGAVEQTWTVTRLEPLDNGGTRVTRTSLGWDTGKDWESTQRFFETQMAQQMRVLARMLGQTNPPTPTDPYVGTARPETAEPVFGRPVLERMNALVGTWVASISDPESPIVSIRLVFNSGPDELSLIRTSEFDTGDGYRPHTTGLCWLDPKSGQVRYLGIDAQGRPSEGTVQLEGEAFVWDVRMDDGPAERRFESRERILSSNRFRMSVGEPSASGGFSLDADFERVEPAKH